MSLNLTDKKGIAVIGHSGAGKTHFQKLFEAEQPDWQTLSVDAEINRVLSENIENYIALWRDRFTSEVQQALLQDGIKNSQDPENLSHLTLWYESHEQNRIKHWQAEISQTRKLVASVFDKPAFLSTPGSVTNQEPEILKQLTEQWLVVYLKLDTNDLKQRAIDQMMRKPIALTPAQLAVQANKSPAVFYQWLLENRHEQYDRLADITLTVSKLWEKDSHDFLQLAAKRQRSIVEHFAKDWRDMNRRPAA